MKNRRPRKSEQFVVENDPFYDVGSGAASTNECTGLVPAAVENEEQSHAYGELGGIHPPRPQAVDKKKRTD